jgi:hypothetical protein
MEKLQQPLYAEESLTASPHVRSKRSFTFVHRAVITALLLVSGLWFISSNGLETGCSRKITVNERAEKILKHSPLIG